MDLNVTFLYSDIRKKHPINPTVTIKLASDSDNGVIPIPIVAATLNFSAKDSQNILIGYGSPVILQFENIVSTNFVTKNSCSQNLLIENLPGVQSEEEDKYL